VSNAQTVAQAGGIAVVVATLDRMRADPQVVRYASSALKYMAGEDRAFLGALCAW
jgi:hypothetical protein